MAGRSKLKNGALVAVGSSDAFDRLRKAGIECGVDPRAMEQLVLRLQGRPLSAKGRLKLDDQELLAPIDDRLARALQNLDDFSLGQSSGRDLAVSIGVLIDKRKALKPEEGAFQRFQDMRSMDEVLEALCKEMIRRGKLIEVAPAPAAEPAENAGNGSVP